MENYNNAQTEIVWNEAHIQHKKEVIEKLWNELPKYPEQEEVDMFVKQVFNVLDIVKSEVKTLLDNMKATQVSELELV